MPQPSYVVNMHDSARAEPSQSALLDVISGRHKPAAQTYHAQNPTLRLRNMDCNMDCNMEWLTQSSYVVGHAPRRMTRWGHLPLVNTVLSSSARIAAQISSQRPKELQPHMTRNEPCDGCTAHGHRCDITYASIITQYSSPHAQKIQHQSIKEKGPASDALLPTLSCFLDLWPTFGCSSRTFWANPSVQRATVRSTRALYRLL